MGTTGSVIKWIRESRGLTRKELATLMGRKSSSTISRIENLPESELPVSTLMALSKAFGTKSIELYNLLQQDDSKEVAPTKSTPLIQKFPQVLKFHWYADNGFQLHLPLTVRAA